jgi:hemerythrin-like domain-containing protein
MWYLNAEEFHLATEKNNIFSFANKWIELENIILLEVSQTQKARRCMFSFICGILT